MSFPRIGFLLGPALLALLGAWAGTFYGGAGFAGSVTGQTAVLGLALMAALTGTARDLDPLRLGRAGRWWLAALVGTVLASWWASPVPRAGRLGLVLLPAYLLLPALLARGWASENGRRWGLRALAVVVATVAGWSLVDHLALGSPRAAAPLGHHNLLALWLLAVLPPAVLPVRERTRWRWLGVAAAALGGAALLATRSLLGAVGLGLLVVLAVRAGPTGRMARRRRPRSLLALAVALVGIVAVGTLFGSRIDDLFAGRDPSAQARAVYWRAGITGIAERPWLGWGPGATPWTVAEHLEPRPGVNPPGEAVGQLHSQPLQIAYELGLPGLALVAAVGGLFGWRRWRESRAEGVEDAALAGVGLAGLAASGVAALGTAALDIPAIPVAWAVVAAAALAGGRGSATLDEPRPPVGPRLAVGLYVGVAGAILLAPARAHLHHDRSLVLEGSEVARELARATELDPAFPWYRAWSAELASADGGGVGEGDPARGGLLARRAAAASAFEAAREARGVAALWLLAGVRGLETGAPWTGEALSLACDLDPLAPLAPFHSLRWRPDAPEAARLGARALLAEPRLLAATFWDRRPGLWAATVDEVRGWPGVPDGWKLVFRETVARVEAERRRSEGPEETPSAAPAGLSRLSAALDREADTSLALHLFRRRPRTRALAPVTVHRRLAETVRLPPATTLPETSPRALTGGGCRAP